MLDELDREAIARSAKMSPEDKLLAGPRLFDQVCRVMRDGIRDEHPNADDETVEKILRERLALARRLERNP
jgi:hypothetical protein